MDYSDPIFHDEDAARAHLEALRWPDGPVCPYCKGQNVKHLERTAPMVGALYCRDCRKQFTVRTGSVFERSHIPLHKWVFGFHMMAASKKGVSAHQLHRMLGITYKSAWFMAHRIREAMKPSDGDNTSGPLGGRHKTVEADETYIGTDKHRAAPARFRSGAGWELPHGPAAKGKRKVIALVERGGRARSIHVPDLTAKSVRNALVTNVRRESDLMTDEARYYGKVGREYASHRTVNHGTGEYVRGGVHTNTIEGYFSIFKRGMKGVYQHCGEKHLHRYLAEFDFRYNERAVLGVDDVTRAARAIKGAEGKRLTYRRTGERAHI